MSSIRKMRPEQWGKWEKLGVVRFDLIIDKSVSCIHLQRNVQRGREKEKRNLV